MFATKFVKVAWHQHLVDINVNFRLASKLSLVKSYESFL